MKEERNEIRCQQNVLRFLNNQGQTVALDLLPDHHLLLLEQGRIVQLDAALAEVNAVI